MSASAFRLPSRRQRAVGLGYAVASIFYVVIGVCFTDFLFSVFVGIAYLLVVTWAIPAGVRRVL